MVTQVALAAIPYGKSTRTILILLCTFSSSAVSKETNTQFYILALREAYSSQRLDSAARLSVTMLEETCRKSPLVVVVAAKNGQHFTHHATYDSICTNVSDTIRRSACSRWHVCYFS